MDLARIFPTAFLKGLATRPPAAAAGRAEQLPPRVSYISHVFTAAMPTSATWKRAFTTCPTLASLPRPRPQLRVLSPLRPHSECASSPSPAQPASGRPPAAGACTSGPPPGLSHLDLLPGRRRTHLPPDHRRPGAVLDEPQLPHVDALQGLSGRSPSAVKPQSRPVR